VRLRLGVGDVRGDDVDVVSTPAGFAGEEVNVLANAAEVRIVVLRDQGNAKRPLVVGGLEER
jgi:hypothetical protein